VKLTILIFMIHYTTPYRTDKDLGRAYNDSMRLCQHDYTHVCLMDGDVMFLTPNWGTIVEEYASEYPDAVLTCRTNRIHHLSKQLLPGRTDASIEGLITEATFINYKRTVTPILPGEGMSGFLMVVPVLLWQQIPFKEGIGCLGVDSQFRIDVHNAGKQILIMDGLLVWHTYRLATGVNDKTHLV
jgi:hypothetical protein